MLALKQIIINNLVASIIKNQFYNEKNDIFLPNIDKLDKQSYNDIKYELEKIKQSVSNKIYFKLSIINDGYEVIDKVIYDTDSYGHIYEVSCKNGFYGLDHEIFSDFRKQKQNYYHKIIYRGIRVGNRKYYIHESILFNEKIFIIGYKDL